MTKEEIEKELEALKIRHMNIFPKTFGSIDPNANVDEEAAKTLSELNAQIADLHDKLKEVENF